MSDKEVQVAESHFKSASNKMEASACLIKDVQDIVRAGNGDNSKVLADLQKLNNNIDLKEKGFPTDFSIVMGSDKGKLVVVNPDKEGGYIVLDSKGEKCFAGNKEETQTHIKAEGRQEKAASSDSSDTKTVTIAPGDTLWKIAKNDLPDGASPKEIAKRVSEIAEANQIKDPDKIKAGDKLTLPGRNKEGATVSEDEQGNKTTKYKDGTERRDNVDKTGSVKNPDGSEKHWGPKDSDNYEITADGKKVGISYGKDREVIKDFGDHKETTWKDGTFKRENKDGTGYVRKPDGSEHHWGPEAKDNYNVTKDGGKEVTDAKGNKTTTWSDGTVKQQNADGTGFVRKPDGSETHWGPNASDNWSKTKKQLEAGSKTAGGTADQPAESMS